MKRHELEHLIRAAGAITGADEIIVIGSQAILGARPDAPESLLRSCEAEMARHDMLDPTSVESRIAGLPKDAADPSSLLARWHRILKAAGNSATP